jgi:acetylornithine/N-succinyldiaminopimelate aminotransferase
VLAGEKTCAIFSTGDHGSTFGGNPIAAAAGLVVVTTVNTPEFLEENKKKGLKLMTALKQMPKVKEVRGQGLMIGFDIENNAWSILESAIARADKNRNGLLMLTGGTNTIRLLPPYIITSGEIEQGLEIIEELLN